MLQAPVSSLQDMHPATFPALPAGRYKRLNVQFRPAPRDARSPVEDRFLSLYIAGWSEANPAKIADATTDSYDFHDPLVGHFSKRTLPQYFGLLRARFAAAGAVRRRDLAFALHGPMQSAPCEAPHQYWREAPFLGLAGVTRISVTRQGIAAEAVAYDLNMACETLRGCGHGTALQRSEQ